MFNSYFVKVIKNEHISAKSVVKYKAVSFSMHLSKQCLAINNNTVWYKVRKIKKSCQSYTKYVTIKKTKEKRKLMKHSVQNFRYGLVYDFVSWKHL